MRFVNEVGLTFKRGRAYIKIKLFQVGLIFMVGLISTRAYITAGTVFDLNQLRFDKKTSYQEDGRGVSKK